MSMSAQRRVGLHRSARELVGLLATTNLRSRVAVVERDQLRDSLRELHGIHLLQGDRGWMDGLPPLLRRELEASLIETSGGIADDRVR